jgi:O-antigen ligase
MVLTRVITVQMGGVLLGASLLTLGMILVSESVLYPGVLKSYEGQQTSQARSSQGRIAVWYQSVHIFLEHPLWGIGSSNAALALTSTADREETVGFASGTFSLPLQMLVEKGFIGLLTYATFLALVARQFIVKMRSLARAPNRSCPYGLRGMCDPFSDRQNSKGFGDPSGQRIMISCFAAGVIALLCRELVYSSVLQHTLTVVLMAILLALICSEAEA